MRLTDELVEFLESGGVSLNLGTRDGQRMPECTRFVGLRVDAGRSRVTLYLPAATSARAVANLEDNGEAAFIASVPSTLRTLQVKGAVMAVRDALPEERSIVDAYMDAFVEELATVGMPRRLARRFTHWPCKAVEMRVRDVYVQTPGPGAGAPWTGGPLP